MISGGYALDVVRTSYTLRLPASGERTLLLQKLCALEHVLNASVAAQLLIYPGGLISSQRKLNW